MKQSYRNPPVVEALCELFFEGGKWDDSTPDALYRGWATDFPVRRELKRVQAATTLSPGDARTGVSESGARMQAVAAGGGQMLQAEPRLLVVNQLAPYPVEGFDAWEPVLRRALDDYARVCAPDAIRRIGIRYINKVELPVGTNVTEFFRVFPAFPSDLARASDDFFLRAEMPVKGENRRLLLSMGVAPTSQPDCRSFVLDLYFVSENSLARPFTGLAADVQVAHEIISDAFEACITDTARSHFNAGMLP